MITLILIGCPGSYIASLTPSKRNMQEKQQDLCPLSDSPFSPINLIPSFTLNVVASPCTTLPIITLSQPTTHNPSLENSQADRGSIRQPPIEARKTRKTKFIMVETTSNSNTR
ncbi:unnamed protein product [Lactuca virosa]|uniref:Uncharacterized protein n=1 Tax=Lactuca virosa TaxID=75947 RepID=A0AAU9N1V7_9ASTR|nr:unnamed protein product [Lactuca virosa]